MERPENPQSADPRARGPSPRDVQSPLRLVLLTTAAIFTVEVFLLLALPRMEPQAEALLAGLVLSAVVAPTLYLSVYRPMRAHLAERDRAEEALKRAEELFRTTLDSTGDGILVLDSMGAVIHTSARFEGLWALPAELLAAREGEAVFRFAADRLEDGPAFLSRVRELHTSSATDVNMLRFKDGRIFGSFTFPWMRAGTLAGRIWSFRDITERRRLEEQLQEAEKMGAMGALVAGVAHEVRNPLFALSATLDAFEARFGEREAFRRHLDILRQQVERLSDLMAELLEYGRPHRPALLPRPLEPLVNEAIAATQVTADERAVRVRPVLPRDLPVLGLDSRRFVQVLTNLIENAVQHAPRGSEVSIAASEEGDGEGRQVRLTVRDQGPGFAPDDLAHLFEPFYAKRTGGTGLGLAVARRIVREHGGSISVGNAREGGALVTVTLPVVEAERGPIRAPPRPSDPVASRRG